MVVLAHLQGVAATFRVGRHHHRGPLCEGRGLTHALTDTAPTDLTVAAALVRKACSKRRRSRLWSKPVNLRTWGLVSDSIAMVQAFAELRYGVVVHNHARNLYANICTQTIHTLYSEWCNCESLFTAQNTLVKTHTSSGTGGGPPGSIPRKVSYVYVYV